MKRRIILCAVSMVIAAAVARALPDGEIQVSLHGAGGFQAGQVVKGVFGRDQDTGNIWLEHAFWQISFDALVKERSRVSIGLDCFYFFGFPNSKGDLATAGKRLYPDTWFSFSQA